MTPSDAAETPAAPQTIGLLGVGHMGAGLAETLRAAGFRIVTALDGRSARSRRRAEAAGAEDLGAVAAVVAAADVFLSVTPADQAEPLAAAVADALTRGGPRAAPLHFVDCNSITPSRTRRIAAVVRHAGAVFSDGGIIGAPPGDGRRPTGLYVSGPHSGVLSALHTDRLAIHALGDGETRATEMKVLFAAMNKGAVALFANVLAAASEVGLLAEVMSEADARAPGLLDGVRGQAAGLPDKAARWAIEMRDLAAGLEDLGVQGGYHATAAIDYDRLAAAFAGDADETPSFEATLVAWVRGQKTSG